MSERTINVAVQGWGVRWECTRRIVVDARLGTVKFEVAAPGCDPRCERCWAKFGFTEGYLATAGYLRGREYEWKYMCPCCDSFLVLKNPGWEEGEVLTKLAKLLDLTFFQ